MARVLQGSSLHARHAMNFTWDALHDLIHHFIYIVDAFFKLCAYTLYQMLQISCGIYTNKIHRGRSPWEVPANPELYKLSLKTLGFVDSSQCTIYFIFSDEKCFWFSQSSYEMVIPYSMSLVPICYHLYITEIKRWYFVTFWYVAVWFHFSRPFRLLPTLIQLFFESVRSKIRNFERLIG